MTFPRNLIIYLLAGVTAQSTYAQQFNVFEVADFNSAITNVSNNSSFTFNNVDNSGVNFTFTFTETIGANSPAGFNPIVNPNNPSDIAGAFSGNGDVENVFNSDPLHLLGMFNSPGDLITLTITTSQAISFSNLIIGDIDRLQSGGTPGTPAGAGPVGGADSFEDHLTITASLSGSNVGVNLSTTSSSILIDGNTAESVSGAGLLPNDTESQIEVGTAGLVDTLIITYQNSEFFGGGRNSPGVAGSNSQVITFGSDDRLTNFTAVPEPSSSILFALGGLGLLLRRKR